MSLHLSSDTLKSFTPETIESIATELLLKKNFSTLEELLPFVSWKMSQMPTLMSIWSQKKNFHLLFFSTCPLAHMEQYLPVLVQQHKAKTPAERDIPILAQALFGALLYQSLPLNTTDTGARTEVCQKLHLLLQTAIQEPLLELLPKDNDPASLYASVEVLQLHKKHEQNDCSQKDKHLYGAPLHFTLLDIVLELQDKSLTEPLFSYPPFLNYLESLFTQKIPPSQLLQYLHDPIHQSFFDQALDHLSSKYQQKIAQDPLFATPYSFLRHLLRYPANSALLESALPYLKRSVQKETQTYHHNPYSFSNEQVHLFNTCLLNIPDAQLARSVGTQLYEGLFLHNRSIKNPHLFLEQLSSGSPLLEQVCLDVLEVQQKENQNNGAALTDNPLVSLVHTFSVNKQLSTLAKIPSFELQKQWLHAMLAPDNKIDALLAYQNERNGLDPSFLMDLAHSPAIFGYTLDLLEQQNLLDQALAEQAWVVGKRKKGDVLAYCVAQGCLEACDLIHAKRPQVNLKFASKALQKIHANEDYYAVNKTKAQSAFDQLLLKQHLESPLAQSEDTPSPLKRRL